MITENTFLSIHYGVVFLAAVGHFLIGLLWYSPLVLGKEWMMANNLKEEDVKKNYLKTYVNAFACGFSSALFLAILFNNVDDVINIFYFTLHAVFNCKRNVMQPRAIVTHKIFSR